MNKNKTWALYGVLLLLALAAPALGVYPVLMMKLLCFALFACAFNLLIGYTGGKLMGGERGGDGAAHRRCVAGQCGEGGTQPNVREGNPHGTVHGLGH